MRTTCGSCGRSTAIDFDADDPACTHCGDPISGSGSRSSPRTFRSQAPRGNPAAMLPVACVAATVLGALSGVLPMLGFWMMAGMSCIPTPAFFLPGLITSFGVYWGAAMIYGPAKRWPIKNLIIRLPFAGIAGVLSFATTHLAFEAIVDPEAWSDLPALGPLKLVVAVATAAATFGMLGFTWEQLRKQR